MRVRYKCIEDPTFSIKQTPSQAYLVIEGKILKDKGTRHQSLAKRSKRSGTENCVCNTKVRNSRHKADQHRKNYLNTNRVKEKQKIKNGHGSFTFRDLSKAQKQHKIVCKYSAQLETENGNLRYENKFLQQYIQTLEDRYQIRPIKRHNSEYQSTRNSFFKRNIKHSEPVQTQHPSEIHNIRQQCSSKVYNH